MPGYERHVQKASLESNLAEYEGYLASTDYVVAKLTEFKLLDDKAFEEAKLKYSDIITARANAREKINEIMLNGKVFPDILITGININLTNSTKIKDLWLDYDIFNEIIEVYSSLWDYSTFQNMKEDKILSEYILNKKKANM